MLRHTRGDGHHSPDPTLPRLQATRTIAVEIHRPDLGPGLRVERGSSVCLRVTPGRGVVVVARRGDTLEVGVLGAAECPSGRVR